MNTALVNALPVIVAAVVAAVVSVLTTRFQVGAQEKHQIQNILLEQRSQRYGFLYSHLSSLIKILEFGKLTQAGELDPSVRREDIVEFLKKVEDWDNENAFYFTENSLNLCHEYRRQMYQLVTRNDNYYQVSLSNPDQPARQELINRTRDLEGALRRELGVTYTEPFMPVTHARRALPKKVRKSIQSRSS
jgi:hypothetical protein